jgi:lipoprotein-releasing system permease protein
VLAVALCVFIVVVVMTVMTGLVGNFKRANHKFVGDCVVGTESLVGFAYYDEFVSTLEQADFIEAISPVIKSYALLSPRNRDLNVGVEIMGIDPARHSRVTGFADTLYFHAGDVANALVPSYDPNLPGCVLGIDLAMERDANSRYPEESAPARVGFSISCFPLTAKGAPAKADLDLVNTQTFYYSDHSHSGIARVDGSVVYLPFEQAQLLCGMGEPVKRINAIHVKFKPAVALYQGREKVAALWAQFRQEKAGQPHANLFDTVTVQTWKENRRAFIAAMEKEQAMMIVMFGFVAITTVFIVFVVFYMVISHKSKDIGILKSVGASNLDIIQLFSGFAFLVGFIGACAGILLGWAFLLNMNRIEDWLFERFGFQLWDRTIYAIGEIPNQVDLHVLAIIMASAIFACWLGAVVPSWQAARLKPVDTLAVSRL